ncbi:hypothetical protein [Pseudobacteriovorax antillogorgiicola]|uniref:tRNA A37 threonylcarbamoyladenosine modification protein TsaB n=1 Tax=Pseudobacteriovorax antillogorgiicola TaxID=1513793 RepID=A0A1Y6B6W4_9BACT|nr:hypothetical protein [Pseudobacteriovorax antillogorgiicola]TCS59548.1 tRNA A37 threonylcarbamoyladenosine modification protein TsaB [Pseudobacteriovorax antillogorgiicola]SME87752.1 tRNA A37 threonylcarbamoyladenosine modification protein TsaB [Pseudobacteriovorax antillogorgiicola]
MNQKKTIIIDTSLKGVSLGLGLQAGDGFECLAWESFFSNHIAAAKLPSLLKNFLQLHEWSLSEVDTILVSQGPGSFTGIKVGLSFVSALGSTQENLEIIGVSPLECLAKWQGKIAWFLPATKTQGYLCLSDIDDRATMYVVDVKDGELLLAREGDRQDTSVDVLGGREIKLLLPWDKLEAVLEQKGLGYQRTSLPVATALCFDAVTGLLTNGQLVRSDELVPRYVRKSAPEELLQKKG